MTATATASSSFSLPVVVRVTATDGLHVRRIPDATSSGNILGGLRPHEEIEALAREGEWLRVRYRGQAAYIHGGFVELAPAHEGSDEHAQALNVAHAERALAEVPAPYAAAAPANPNTGTSQSGLPQRIHDAHRL